MRSSLLGDGYLLKSVSLEIIYGIQHIKNKLDYALKLFQLIKMAKNVIKRENHVKIPKAWSGNPRKVFTPPSTKRITSLLMTTNSAGLLRATTSNTPSVGSVGHVNLTCTSLLKNRPAILCVSVHRSERIS